ncbi:MAG: lipopolysaccharide transport periplasmic protein LptA [Burkholderiales bacterium]
MLVEKAIRRLRLLVLLGCATLALAAPVHAEKADRTKPIHLEADRVTVDDVKQIATFTGNVVLTQGSMTMRGDRMQVRQDKSGFRHGTTWGSLAYFRQKRDSVDEFIEGWAERIEYDSRTDKVEMFNRAMLRRGQDQVQGSYISYDVATEFFQVTGGDTKSATSKSSENRVRAIFQPKAKDTSASPSVPLKRDSGDDVPRGETSGPASR